jgi:cupin superfamily acireductone dioxygenase involved in methionine salvage
MDFSRATDLAFHRIKDALDKKLNSQGYQIVNSQYNDQVFGSRFVIWSNNEDDLRFIWDGKEGWFVLQVSDTLPLSLTTAWNDIIIVPYNSEVAIEADIDKIINDFLGTLN